MESEFSTAENKCFLKLHNNLTPFSTGNLLMSITSAFPPSRVTFPDELPFPEFPLLFLCKGLRSNVGLGSCNVKLQWACELRKLVQLIPLLEILPLI